MNASNAHARVLAGFLICTLSSVIALPAYADGPPAGAVTSVSPPEVPRSATIVDPSSPAEPAQSTQPVEFLPGDHPSRLAAYIFAGIAVVGVGVGTAFGVLALNNQSHYDATPTGSSLSAANQDAVIADVAIGAAVMAGVTSVVLFLRRDEPAPGAGAAPSSHASTVSFSVAPVMTPHGAGAGAVLRF